MNISGSLPPIFSITSAVNASGAAQRSPVSEESVDAPLSSLKPIEQSAESRALDLSSQNTESEQARKAELEQQLERKEAEQERLDQQVIQQLSARDREVRNHERAHAAVGGQYAGAPRYEYERGPDGVSYAVGGEVSISTGAVSGDPQQTIEKAQVVRRAALAPAEPSPQDFKVAAEAAQLEAQARAELAATHREERAQEQQDSEQATETIHQEEVGGVTLTTTTENTTEALLSSDDNAADNINTQQQEAFTQLNEDLTRQLVSLGATQAPAQSLGNIVSQFV